MSQEAADDSKYVECIFELFRTEVDLKTFEPFWHIFLLLLLAEHYLKCFSNWQNFSILDHFCDISF